MGEFEDINKARHKEAIKKFSPNTDLQLSYMVTAPAWGDPTEITDSLREDLKKSSFIMVKAGEIREVRNPDGSTQTINFKKNTLMKTTRDSWLDLQAIFTRDLRLGNLNGQEVVFCNYMISFSGEMIDEGFNDAFAKSLRMAITPLELSQSRSFALRKMMNTLLTEQKIKEEEAPKKSLLGSNRRE